MPTPPTPARLDIVDKVDAILRVLEDDSSAAAPEIAAKIGEPVSSTYRLLANLQNLGWVERAPHRGGVRLGVDLLRVGGALEDRLDVRDAALPELRHLRAETGVTAFLLVRAGDRAVCIDRIEGSAVRSLALTLGHSLPLHRGAAPRAILAHLPPAERDALLATLLGTDAPAGERDALLALLAAARADGVALSDEDVTPGIASYGSPILNHRGEVAAALSISGPRALVLSPDLAAERLVLDAASRASRALGYAREEESHAR